MPRSKIPVKEIEDTSVYWVQSIFGDAVRNIVLNDKEEECYELEE